jgi:hypothetical protein
MAAIRAMRAMILQCHRWFEFHLGKTMKPYFIMTSIAVAALMGCVQSTSVDHAGAANAHTEDTASQKQVKHSHATVKPGAAITFSHSFEGPLIAGEQGQVMLTISEAYTSGVVNVDVIVDEGLSVFGSSLSKTVQLSGGPDHTWPITFSAVQNGVQYLRVRAVTEIDGQPSSARSYAVRIDVGGSSDTSVQKATASTMMPDGNAVIMLEAEETTE